MYRVSGVLRWPRMGRGTMTIWMEMIPGTLAPTGHHWPPLAPTGHWPHGDHWPLRRQWLGGVVRGILMPGHRSTMRH